jgi:adenylate cyclase
MKRETRSNHQELLARIMQCVYAHTPAITKHNSSQLEADIDRVIRETAETGGARSSDVTILLSDIRGFTVLAEHYPAADIVRMLNNYFACMNEIIYRYNGVIDKYMGDAIMVLFGVPETGADDEHRAVACAIEMQQGMDAVNKVNALAGLPELFMGIGINTGSVSSGQVGSELHQEYTVIGDGVNLASRIEAYSLRGQILISEYTFDRLKGDFEVGDRNQVKVKGKSDPVELYEIVASNWGERQEVPRREIRNSPRVEVDIQFSYHSILGKDVNNRPHKAYAKDIGYYGLYAHAAEPIEVMTDIKFSMAVSLLGNEVEDIYAKVTSVRKINDGSFGFGLEFTSMDPRGRQAIKDFVNNILESL